MANKRDITIKKRKSTALLEYTVEKSPELGELTSIPGRRKRRKHHTLLRVLLRLIIVAALVSGGIVVWQNWDVLAPESLVIWVNEKIGGGQSGDGFPVEITGSSVLDMTQTQDGLVLMTDTSFLMLNSKGGELVRRQHGFTKPILKTAGKWSLIAEAGGSRLRVETRAATAVEMTMSNQIVGGSMGKNGNFALATNSSRGYTSEVVVYNRHKEDIYHWYSTDLTIVDVALSPDGQSIAVVGVMASNGSMKSSILIFDLDKKEPVAQYNDTNLLLCAIDYFPNGTVAAVGDKALWVVNTSGTISQKHSYNDHQLIGFTIGDSAVSVVLRNYGSSESGEIMTVNPSGDKAYSIPYIGAFRSLAPYDKGLLLLTSEKLYQTNAAGIMSTADVVRDGRLVSALNDKVIVLGLTSLNECVMPTK